ncbi:actin depolymerizing protein, partial [Hanseniaspora valbyensis NRRL Y-1626]
MNNNTVSFSKNGAEIKDTYLNIINNATEGLKWLVITNDASNELYVEETGESLKDFVDFLSEDATKVKYGICKTIPPGSDVEKLLFIGFCSDYLSIKPKMSFMKNLQIVRDDLFNNYHVMMEIRDESDLNYEAISKRLGDAAGARYSIQTGNSKVEKKGTPVFEKKSTPTTPVVEKATPIIEKATPVVEKATPTPAPAAKIAPKKEQVADDDEDDWSEPPLEEKEIGHKGSYTTSNWTPIGKVDLKKLIAEEKAKVDPRLVKE